MAEELMRDPEVALETHAREELGIDPSSLGSPWSAAISSFIAFTVGAIIPLMPWFFAHGDAATIASVVLGAIASVVVGVALARLTGRSPLRSGLRQLAIATGAAAVTFAVGRVVGVGVG
jgi:VIT1/CCC1 family predicted Fe2+/Mn2+ transporter